MPDVAPVLTNLAPITAYFSPVVPNLASVVPDFPPVLPELPAILSDLLARSPFANVLAELALIFSNLPAVLPEFAPVLSQLPPVLPELFSIPGDLPGVIAELRVLSQVASRAGMLQHEVGGPGMLGEPLRQSRVRFQKLVKPGMPGDPFGKARILRHVVRRDVRFLEPRTGRGRRLRAARGHLSGALLCLDLWDAEDHV